jgi:DNA-binding CsgD family transcriptional regulator
MPEASPALIARALQLTPPQLSSPARRHRDVAAALFISTKTVEANLVRIYRKLGIKTRAELGRIIGDVLGRLQLRLLRGGRCGSPGRRDDPVSRSDYTGRSVDRTTPLDAERVRLRRRLLIR